MGEGGIQPMGRAGAAGVAQCRSGCRYYRKKERHMYSRPHIPVPYGSLRAKIIRKAAQFGSSGRPHSLQGSGLTAGQVYCLGNALGSLVTSLSQWSEPQRVYHVTKPPLRTSRTALRRPIRFLLRRPNRRQDRRSLRRSFPENLITCIVTLTPHVTHHVQSSRDSRLSRFTKCLSPSLSHPLSLYVRSFPTLHSRAAQLHSLHSCTVSVVDCALSTVRSNAQSAVVYAQHCTVIPQECTVNAQPPLMYIRPPFCTQYSSDLIF